MKIRLIMTLVLIANLCFANEGDPRDPYFRLINFLVSSNASIPGTRVTWQVRKFVEGSPTQDGRPGPTIGIVGNWGPCTVYRNGEAIATVSGSDDSYSYHDLSVRAGEAPNYEVAFGSYSTVEPKNQTCLLSYFADVSESIIQMDVGGDEKSISILGKMETYDRYKKILSVTSIDWTATCSSTWLTVSKSIEGNALLLSAPACTVNAGRRAVVRVVIEGYTVKHIIVAQGCKASGDDVIVDNGEGGDIAIPRSWFDAYPRYAVYPYMPTGKTDGDGHGMYVWHDYVIGTDPTDPNDLFRTQISFKNGVPYISWSPNLNTNGIVRSYTIWGKESLTEAAWHSPTNAADRFFKVSVEMP